MVLPPSKQRSIQELYSQGTRVADICKKVHADRKTVNKYLGLSTQTPSFQQIQRRPAIPIYDRQPQPSFRDNENKRYNDPEIERMFNFYTRDDARDYRRKQDQPTRHDNPYDLRFVHPIHSETPPTPEPLNIYEQELANLRNRTGIPVENNSMDKWIKFQEKQLEQQREDERSREHQERMNALNQEIIDANLQKKQAKERENFERDMAPEQHGLTKEGVREAIKGAVEANNEGQKKISMAFGELCNIQNNEVYRVKKNQINEKFISDIAPSVFDFIGNVIRSVKIVQTPKKPLFAKVLK